MAAAVSPRPALAPSSAPSALHIPSVEDVFGSSVPRRVQPAPATLPADERHQQDRATADAPTTRGIKDWKPSADSGDLGPSQFGPEAQATGVAASICGPIAAVQFAAAYGRAPSVAEAVGLAKQGGNWDAGTGMHGPDSEASLLDSMGVPNRIDHAPSKDAVIRDVTTGNPVILSSPNHYHYFVASGYDPSTGLFDTGNTGEALKGGSRWRSWDDIAPQAALFVDEPSTPVHSQAVDPTTMGGVRREQQAQAANQGSPAATMRSADQAAYDAYDTPEAREAFVRDRSARYGIDPNVAVAVVKSEGGFDSWNRQSDYVNNGVREPSYGPMQLYMNGGLGNAFMDETGLDPRDPANGPAATDWALRYAAQHGWGDWHGAQRIGLDNYAGINGNPANLPPADVPGGPSGGRGPGMAAPLPRANPAGPYTDPGANPAAEAVIAQPSWMDPTGGYLGGMDDVARGVLADRQQVARRRGSNPLFDIHDTLRGAGGAVGVASDAARGVLQGAVTSTVGTPGVQPGGPYGPYVDESTSGLDRSTAGADYVANRIEDNAQTAAHEALYAGPQPSLSHPALAVHDALHYILTGEAAPTTERFDPNPMTPIVGGMNAAYAAGEPIAQTAVGGVVNALEGRANGGAEVAIARAEALGPLGQAAIMALNPTNLVPMGALERGAALGEKALLPAERLAAESALISKMRIPVVDIGNGILRRATTYDDTLLPGFREAHLSPDQAALLAAKGHLGPQDLLDVPQGRALVEAAGITRPTTRAVMTQGNLEARTARLLAPRGGTATQLLGNATGAAQDRLGLAYDDARQAYRDARDYAPTESRYAPPAPLSPALGTEEVAPFANPMGGRTPDPLGAFNRLRVHAGEAFGRAPQGAPRDAYGFPTVGGGADEAATTPKAAPIAQLAPDRPILSVSLGLPGGETRRAIGLHLPDQWAQEDIAAAHQAGLDALGYDPTTNKLGALEELGVAHDVLAPARVGVWEGQPELNLRIALAPKTSPAQARAVASYLGRVGMQDAVGILHPLPPAARRLVEGAKVVTGVGPLTADLWKRGAIESAMLSKPDGTAWTDQEVTALGDFLNVRQQHMQPQRPLGVNASMLKKPIGFEHSADGKTLYFADYPTDMGRVDANGDTIYEPEGAAFARRVGDALRDAERAFGVQYVKQIGYAVPDLVWRGDYGKSITQLRGNLPAMGGGLGNRPLGPSVLLGRSATRAQSLVERLQPAGGRLLNRGRPVLRGPASDVYAADPGFLKALDAAHGVGDAQYAAARQAAFLTYTAPLRQREMAQQAYDLANAPHVPAPSGLPIPDPYARGTIGYAVEQLFNRHARDQGVMAPTITGRDLMQIPQVSHMVRQAGYAEAQGVDAIRTALRTSKPYAAWYDQIAHGLAQDLGVHFRPGTPEHADFANEVQALMGVFSPQREVKKNAADLIATLKTVREMRQAGTLNLDEVRAAWKAGGGGDVAKTATYKDYYKRFKAIRYAAGEKVDVPGDVLLKPLVGYATGEMPTSGVLKTPSFNRNLYASLLGEFDPESTMDTWMFRAIGMDPKESLGSPEAYQAANAIIQRIAREEGVSYKGAQAAIWNTIRSGWADERAGAKIIPGRAPTQPTGSLGDLMKRSRISLGTMISKAQDLGVYGHIPHGMDEVRGFDDYRRLVDDFVESRYAADPTPGLGGTMLVTSGDPTKRLPYAVNAAATADRARRQELQSTLGVAADATDLSPQAILSLPSRVRRQAGVGQVYAVTGPREDEFTARALDAAAASDARHLTVHFVDQNATTLGGVRITGATDPVAVERSLTAARLPFSRTADGQGFQVVARTTDETALADFLRTASAAAKDGGATWETYQGRFVHYGQEDLARHRAGTGGGGGAEGRPVLREPAAPGGGGAEVAGGAAGARAQGTATATEPGGQGASDAVGEDITRAMQALRENTRPIRPDDAVLAERLLRPNAMAAIWVTPEGELLSVPPGLTHQQALGDVADPDAVLRDSGLVNVTMVQGRDGPHIAVGSANVPTDSQVRAVSALAREYVDPQAGPFRYEAIRDGRYLMDGEGLTRWQRDVADRRRTDLSLGGRNRGQVDVQAALLALGYHGAAGSVAGAYGAATATEGSTPQERLDRAMEYAPYGVAGAFGALALGVGAGVAVKSLSRGGPHVATLGSSLVKGGDTLRSFYAANLMSNPASQFRNITSNILSMATQPVESELAAGSFGIAKWLASQPNAVRTRYGHQEIKASAAGSLRGAVDGFNTMMEILASGETAAPTAWSRAMAGNDISDLSRVTNEGRTVVRGLPMYQTAAQRAASGRGGLANAAATLASPITAPLTYGVLRPMTATDEFFKGLIYHQAVNTEFYRLARARGLKGAQADRAVTQYFDDIQHRITHSYPIPDEMKGALQRAGKYARYQTFQQQMDQVGKGLTMIQRIPVVGSFLMPFTRTPYNILKYGLERSPLGIGGALVDVARGVYNPASDLAKAHPEQLRDVGDLADRLARFELGMGFFVSSIGLYQAGILTGAAPTDSGEAKAWRLAGNKEFSIHIPGTDQFIPMLQIPSLGPTMAATVGVLDARAKQMKQSADHPDEPPPSLLEQGARAFDGAVASMQQQGFAQAWQALANLIDGFSGRQGAPSENLQAPLTRQLGSIVTGLVPGSAALRAVTNAPEPVTVAGHTVIPATGDQYDRLTPGILDDPQAIIPPAAGALGIPNAAQLRPQAVLGRPIPRQRRTVLDTLFNPLSVVGNRTDAVDRELAALGIRVPGAGSTVEGQKLTQEQRNAYDAAIGTYARPQFGGGTAPGLDQLIADPDYRALPTERRKELVDKMITTARSEARYGLLSSGDAGLPTVRAEDKGEPVRYDPSEVIPRIRDLTDDQRARYARNPDALDAAIEQANAEVNRWKAGMDRDTVPDRAVWELAALRRDRTREWYAWAAEQVRNGKEDASILSELQPAS